MSFAQTNNNNDAQVYSICLKVATQFFW